MKKFNELTRLGRIRRARKIILEALEHYDLDIETMDFLTEDTNIFFKIKTKNQKKYAVKLYQELSSDLDDSKAELYFLSEIGNSLDVVVPHVVANRMGDLVTVIDTAYDEVAKRIAVYTWMDGKDIDEIETPEMFRKIGVVMAKMHQFSQRMTIPSDIKSKKLDKVLYYAGDDYFYKNPKHQSKINEDYIKLMDFVIPYLDKRMQALYEKEPILIHGDFNPYNIKTYKGDIRLLDFEDTSLGYPIHDVAILFFYYQYDDQYELYKDAFYQGYNTVLDIGRYDDQTIQMLMTARRVNFLNYILEIHDQPEKYIERNMARVQDYLKRVKA